MMGIAPLVVFFLVAVNTFLTADKRGNRLLVDMRYRYTDVFLLYNVKRNGENDNDGRNESGYFPILHGILFTDPGIRDGLIYPA